MGKVDIFWIGKSNGNNYIAPYAVWGRHSERWGNFLFWENNNNNTGSILVVGSKKLVKTCQTKQEAFSKLLNCFRESGNESVSDYLPDSGGYRKGTIKTSVAKRMAEFNLCLPIIPVPDERTLFNISIVSGIKYYDISIF